MDRLVSAIGRLQTTDFRFLVAAKLGKSFSVMAILALLGLLGKSPQAIQPFFEYLRTYYAFGEQLSLTGWHVYEFVGEK